MDMKHLLERLTELVKKYKYAILVLIIGIVLMLLPDSSQRTEEIVVMPTDNAVTEISVEEKLASILQQIDGAGKVEVMLTVGIGEETVFQCNENISASGETNTVQKTTVTVTDSQRNQTGLIRQIIPPTYLGAIIVCEGGSDPAVQYAIVDAVSKITGLGANRISVLKMK